MKKPAIKFIWAILVALILTLLVITGVIAQERAFTLSRSVIGSGGMGGSASGFTLTSTLGQPVTGSFSSGDLTFTSGFWGQALMEWFENFLPLILH